MRKHSLISAAFLSFFPLIKVSMRKAILIEATLSSSHSFFATRGFPSGPFGFFPMTLPRVSRSLSACW